MIRTCTGCGAVYCDARYFLTHLATCKRYVHATTHHTRKANR